MSYIIADAHCDSILEVANGQRNMAEKSFMGHLDFPRMLEGQISLQFMALFIERRYQSLQALKRTLELIDLIKKQVAQVDYISIVQSKADLGQLNPELPKILLSIEGGEAIDDSLEVLRCYYELGIRSMTLTWNYRNKIAVGCAEQIQDQGLSEFGQKVILEMNSLGMLIDVSHLSENSFWDVLVYSKQPVIASHSCCRALANHPRNLTDQQMKSLSQMGGVLAINFYPYFLNLSSQATIDNVLQHIVYACEIMGPEHVGLGSDFDGIEVVPQGLETCVHLPKLVEGLKRKGLSNLEIQKIMGYNIVSLLKKVLK